MADVSVAVKACASRAAMFVASSINAQLERCLVLCSRATLFSTADVYYTLLFVAFSFTGGIWLLRDGYIGKVEQRTRVVSGEMY